MDDNYHPRTILQLEILTQNFNTAIQKASQTMT